MKCDTQLLYGASGPTRVNEDGSRRQMSAHARDKDMYRCACDRHCAEETDTQQGYQQRILKTQTWDPTLSNISRHLCTTTSVQPHLGNKSSLRLTHLQCSQFTWSRNQRNVTSCHAADSVTFAERVRNSKSRPCSMIHKNWDRCSQTVSHCTFINKFVQTSLIPLHAHPDSHSSNFSYLQLISPFAYSLVSHHSSSREELLRISRSPLRRSTISSSAVIIHCASCRIFCRTASDFLEACFVKQSDISHRSTSSQFHHTLPWP